MASSLLLATSALPFATTGTIFALASVFGQWPATIGRDGSGVSAEPWFGGRAWKAKSWTLSSLALCGRATAQITESRFPLEETLVKNPPSCSCGPIFAYVLVPTSSRIRTTHTQRLVPPLVTMYEVAPSLK